MRTFIVMLSVLTNCAAPVTSHMADVDHLLRSYVRAESAGDYESVFTLLSNDYRKRIRKDFGVVTPQDYKRFRDSSEARWFDFTEVARSIRPDARVEVTFHATVEENGERENNAITLTVDCDDGCTIDDWDY